jgi:hypothetical protein
VNGVTAQTGRGLEDANPVRRPGAGWAPQVTRAAYPTVRSHGVDGLVNDQGAGEAVLQTVPDGERVLSFLGDLGTNRTE